MIDEFVCPLHDRSVAAGKDSPGCSDCLELLDDVPRDPATMTGEERATELRHWLGIMTVPDFSRIHERVEVLVGRPVWTHEMAASVVDKLFTEAETWDHPEDPFAEAVESLSDMMGAENVYVYPEAPRAE